MSKENSFLTPITSYSQIGQEDRTENFIGTECIVNNKKMMPLPIWPEIINHRLKSRYWIKFKQAYVELAVVNIEEGQLLENTCFRCTVLLKMWYLQCGRI